MKKIEDKDLDKVSGAGDAQDVKPRLGTNPGTAGGTEPPGGGGPGPEGEGNPAGDNQDLQQ